MLIFHHVKLICWNLVANVGDWNSACSRNPEYNYPELSLEQFEPPWWHEINRTKISHNNNKHNSYWVSSVWLDNTNKASLMRNIWSNFKSVEAINIARIQIYYYYLLISQLINEEGTCHSQILWLATVCINLNKHNPVNWFGWTCWVNLQVTS